MVNLNLGQDSEHIVSPTTPFVLHLLANASPWIETTSIHEGSGHWVENIFQIYAYKMSDELIWVDGAG